MTPAECQHEPEPFPAIHPSAVVCPYCKRVGKRQPDGGIEWAGDLESFILRESERPILTIDEALKLLHRHGGKIEVEPRATAEGFTRWNLSFRGATRPMFTSDDDVLPLSEELAIELGILDDEVGS